MNEVWKPVLGYEGIYEASDLGRVRILVKRQNIRPGTMLALTTVRDGYLAVRLNRNDGSPDRSIAVSRVIYEAHKGQNSPGLQIDHLNAIRIDNRLENLEPVTCAVNNQRAVARGGRCGERNGSAKLTAEIVLLIRERAASGERFGRIARDVSMTSVMIGKIAYGHCWKHIGGPRCTPRGRIGRPPKGS